MSARGADISSTKPALDIQVKFAGYWHGPTQRPQPIGIKQIEKDLCWLLNAENGQRAMVLFLPQRLLGYGVQGAGGDHEPGCRRFQHVFSATDDILAATPNCALLVHALSEEAIHIKTNGTLATFRQYRNVSTYNQVLDAKFQAVTVGDPQQDLVWALVIVLV